MNQFVVMKSFQNGISIHMDSEADFSDILSEIADKFTNARAFFKDVKVALSLEGRNLTTEEEKQIISNFKKIVNPQNENAKFIELIEK